MCISNPPAGGSIEPLTMADLDELVQLHDVYLNYGDGIRPHFQEALSDPDTIAYKYVIDGETAGDIVFTKGVALSGGHEDICEKALEAAGGEPVYTGDAVLVRSQYRKRGISKLLFTAVRDELSRRGVGWALHEFWVYPDGRAPAEGVIHIYPDYIYLGKYEGFYRDFYHWGYVCPICGKNCVCAAKIYLARIPKA